jgi:hypothetical protein
MCIIGLFDVQPLGYTSLKMHPLSILTKKAASMSRNGFFYQNTEGVKCDYE